MQIAQGEIPLSLLSINCTPDPFVFIISHSDLDQIGQILFLRGHMINSDFSTFSEYFIFRGDSPKSMLQGTLHFVSKCGN